METSLFAQSGPLRLSWTSELLYFEPDEDAVPVLLGYIWDPTCVPPEYAEDHQDLFGRWREDVDYDRACRAAADAAWRRRSSMRRMDPSHWN